MNFASSARHTTEDSLRRSWCRARLCSPCIVDLETTTRRRGVATTKALVSTAVALVGLGMVGFFVNEALKKRAFREHCTTTTWTSRGVYLLEAALTALRPPDVVDASGTHIDAAALVRALAEHIRRRPEKVEIYPSRRRKGTFLLIWGNSWRSYVWQPGHHYFAWLVVSRNGGVAITAMHLLRTDDGQMLVLSLRAYYVELSHDELYITRQWGRLWVEGSDPAY